MFSVFIVIIKKNAMKIERMISLQRSNFILLIFAVIIFTAVPKNALAESVSVSASVSAGINVEINSEPRQRARSNSLDYTGVIIDCRGLDLQRAMSPVIKDENGKIIYGDKNLDFDKINEIGMVSYATNMHETSRAGSHPLIVRAIGLTNFRSNPVLSNADAHKILITDEVGDYLRNLNVVFLTD